MRSASALRSGWLADHEQEMNLLDLRVAALGLRLDASDSRFKLVAPGCHEQFLVHGEVPGMALRVREGKVGDTRSWRSVFYSSDSWALWIDESERYVFRPSLKSPPRRYVSVDQGFTSGEVLVESDRDFSLQDAFYPLVDIDIVLYVNWLARFGDFLVHSAGISDRGEGYCFVGPSGMGKSTLATLWATASSATVLGDDQVILRYLEGRFWMFGTPWHQDPRRCSPRGVPVTKMFFLCQDTENAVCPCASSQVVPLLLKSSFIPYYNADGVGRILDNLARLLEHVAFYTLRFRPEPNVLALVREA